MKDLLVANEQIGRHFSKIRKRKGITIAKLSELSGWSEGFISRFEKGMNERVNIPALSDCVNAIGLTNEEIKEMFTFTDEEMKEWEE